LRQFQNIQALRGIAALIVMLVHSVAMPVDVGMGNLVALWGAIGPAGVDLFFVISGFIIATVAVDAGGRVKTRFALSEAAVFGLKRGARVYPIYWVVFGAALIAKSYGVFLAPAAVPDQPLWQLFFLVNPTNNIVMLAWTLVHELYFYVVVTILLAVFPRNMFRALFLWALVTLSFSFYLALRRDPLGGLVPFNPMIVEFIFGIVIAYLIRTGATSHAIGCISLGLVWFAVGAYENHNYGSWQPWQRTLAFGPSSALIVYGFLAAEIRFGWISAKAWRRLGDASYSLYIWHQLIFFCLLKLAQHHGWFEKIPGHYLVPMWMVGVLAWSFMSYYLIETPLRRRLELLIVRAFGRREDKGAVSTVAS